MHPTTYLIEVFETEAARVRQSYRSSLFHGGKLDLKAIEQRDYEVEQCLNSIELLHSAYIAEIEGLRVNEFGVIAWQINMS